MRHLDSLSQAVVAPRSHFCSAPRRGSKDYAYLWILSRTPQLRDPVVKQLVEKAKGLGFKTDARVFVKQQ
jgi:lipocalin